MIDRLPTLVALPLARSAAGGGQRKDLLRLAFENLVGILGAVVVGDLLDQLGEIERAEDPTEAQNGITSALRGDEGDALLAPLRSIGLEQMALGKWLALLRAMNVFVPSVGITPRIPDAIEVYGACKKAMDELVRIRNEDAHGPAIPPEKLDEVLDERQALIESVLDRCGFLESWSMVQFDRFEIEGDRQVRIGTRFRGPDATSVRLEDVADGVPLRQPLLLDASGRNWVNLSPLLLVAPIDGGGGSHAAVFSKEIKGDSGRLSFVGAEGSSTIEVDRWVERHGAELDERRRLLRRYFRSPELRSPGLEADMRLASTRIVVGEDGTSLVMSVANRKGAAEIEAVRLVVSLPECLEFQFKPREDVHLIDSRRCEWQIDMLAPGERRELELEVIATGHGAEVIPPAIVEFEYRRSEDSDSLDAAGSEEVDGVVVEAIHHGFEDPVRPIVNIERRIIPAQGSTRIEIGDVFEFEVRIENAGLGRAEGVSAVVVPSDGLSIVEGDREFGFSLAPGASRSLRWVVRAERHGIHQIRVSDLVYRDLAGMTFVTECSEERQFLVRADRRKRLRYAMREILDDLVIDTQESSRITALTDGLKNLIPDDQEREKVRHAAESDAVIQVVRRLVEEAFEGRAASFRENLHHETSWQEKKHPDRGRRRVLSYFWEEIPFFAIDISDSAHGNLWFHSIPVKGFTDRAPFVNDEAMGIYPDSRTLNGTLNHVVGWADLRAGSPGGVRFFKQWLARIVQRIEREYVPWRTTSRSIAALLGGRAVLQRSRYELAFSEGRSELLGLQETGGSIRSRLYSGAVLPEGKPGTFRIGLLPGASGKPSRARIAAKWLGEQIREGLLPGHTMCRLVEDPAAFEAADSGVMLLTTCVDSDQTDGLGEVVSQLIRECRAAAWREAGSSTVTEMRGGVPAILNSERMVNWLEPRLDDLAAAGILCRLTPATRADVRGTLEFVLPDVEVNGEPRVLGRLLPGGGDGECWIAWYEGMADDHPVLDLIELPEDRWSATEKVPVAINPGLSMRLRSDALDDGSLAVWVDAMIVAASVNAKPAWPARFRPFVLEAVRRIEPRFDWIATRLAEGKLSLDQLVQEAGGDGKPIRLAANRLASWQSRYDRAAPLRRVDDSIELAAWARNPGD